MKKRLLAVLLAVMIIAALGTVTAWAEDTPMSGYCGAEGNEENVTWELTPNNSGNSTTYTLTISGSGAMMDFGGESISAEKDKDFPLRPWYHYVNQITSVTISDTITHIGDGAFYKLTNINTSLDLPDELISIGDYAFQGSTFNGQLVFPNNLKSIGTQAFATCDNFTNTTLIIPASVTKISGGAFLRFNWNEDTKVPINNNWMELQFAAGSQLETIEGNAFNRAGVTLKGEVSLPSRLKSIGSNAFLYDSANNSVTSITFPNTLATIGDYAFKNWSGITSIDLPKTVTSLGKYAFTGCTSITAADISSLHIKEIPEGLFDGCTALVTLKLPEGLTAINSNAFRNTAITSYTIPETMESIGSQAFAGTKLTEVMIPDSVKTIGGGSFRTPELTTVILGFGITDIGDQAFYESDVTAGVGSRDLVYVDASRISQNVTVGSGVFSTDSKGVLYFSSKDIADKFQRKVGNGRAAITNGGVIAEDPTDFTKLAVLTKAGYTFDGWYTTPAFDVNSKVDSVSEGNYTYIQYYAKWTLDAPTVTVTTDKSYIASSETATLTATAAHELDSVTLKYQWYTGTPDSGNAIDGATNATYTVSNLSTATSYYCKVTAVNGSDKSEAVSDAVTVNPSKNPGSVTITYPTEDTKTVNLGDRPFDVIYTVSGDRAATLISSNTSVATVSGNTVTIVGIGTAEITVNFAGDNDYSTASDSFTLVVKPADKPVNIPDTYDIDLIVSDGGEAKTNLSNASAGTTITVTTTPDEGYKLDYITVDGERISGTSFKMPAHDVTVRVYFTDGTSTLPFTDVRPNQWFYDAVAYVYTNGMMEGDSATTFNPDGQMTRAMVWSILARIDGETVTGANWIDTARVWAMSEGVSDGTDPTGLVTREQLATMLWRYAGEPESDYSLSAYTDAASVSDWAAEAMAWAVENGIISGVTATTLYPQGTATRAQCAAILMRSAEDI